jgi:hypothetical protein
VGDSARFSAVSIRRLCPSKKEIRSEDDEVDDDDEEDEDKSKRLSIIVIKKSKDTMHHVIAATSRADDRRFGDCAELFLLRYFLLSSLVIDFLETCMASYKWLKKLVVIKEDVRLNGLY